jgi:BNR repeat-like domain
MRVLRLVGILAIGAGLAVVVAASASAAVTAPVQVTGASPFAPGCAGPGHDPTGRLYEDGEVEPWVAVDPAAPSHIAGAWQQDRWSDGGSHGLVAGTSLDGGASWLGETFADFSRCPLFAHYGDPDAQDPGRQFDRGSDPWVSWGAGSRLHQIALTVSQPEFGLGLNAGILVSHSDDFGAHWSHPQVIKQDHGGNVLDDKESITGDPASGYVYAIWDRLEAPNSHANLAATENAIGYRGPTWFASSPDNGTTWSPARKIYDPGEVNQTIANQIAVMPDGSLLDVFLQINNFKNAHGSRGFNVSVMRSSDHGATWSAPVVVSKLVDRTVRTPGDGLPVRTGDIAPDIAIDGSTGSAYVVWQDASSGTPAIELSKSTDGGRHWSGAQQVSDSPAGVSAFTPSVDVNGDGAVGVTFYDFRNDTPDTATALTDYWIRTSSDGGTSWMPSQRVTPTSFDMKKAPVARGFFVGDYEGLDHSGNTFKVFFVQTHNADTGTNPTDVYAADATP